MQHALKTTPLIRFAIALIVVIMLCLVFLPFLSSVSQPKILPEGSILPNRDIVFTIDNGQIGFINSNGSGFVMQKVGRNILGWPLGFYWIPAIGGPNTWSPNGNLVVGRYPSTTAQSGAPLFIRKEGSIHSCANNVDNLYGDGRIGFVSNTEIVTVVLNKNHKNMVVTASIESCVIETILYQSPDSYWESIGDATLSSKGWLAITRWLRKTMTGDLIILSPNGSQIDSINSAEHPAWSADGDWLAYSIHKDGLYIIRKDGLDKRKILDLTDSYVRLAPSWSPDGEWIIYDRRVPKDEQYFEPAIFKVNIKTGAEYELFRGGYDPNWRWLSSK